MSASQSTPIAPQTLGDGLVLRWSTAADMEKITELIGHVFRGKAEDPANLRMMDEMRVIMRGDFPYMDANDFAVVEDTSKPEAPLVACTCLWQHSWSYGGIPFSVGRPEFVATDPAYRNRGLVRKIFQLLHERSDGRGDLMQGITGIPYFYRQFGYEMVLDLDVRRYLLVDLLPPAKTGEEESCTLRRATAADVPLLTTLHEQNQGDSLLWHEADEAFWHYLVTYWDDPAIQQEDRTVVGMNAWPQMIVDPAGNSLGMVVVGHHRRRYDLGVYELALAAETNLQQIAPSLARALCDYAQQAPTMDADAPPLRQLSLRLGRVHPLYLLLSDAMLTPDEPPYAWYIRIPDLPAFIRQVAPVLEARLADSLLRGHTGTFCIDLYRTGLQMKFTDGKLTAVESWRPAAFGDEASAGCPPLVFSQLLLGHRSLTELRTIYPDVWAKNEARLLLETLFPKTPSTLMPMG